MPRLAGGPDPASGLTPAVRAAAWRRGTISVRFDGGADVFGGRAGKLIYLFLVFSVCMKRTSAVHWFAKCGVGAGLLLLACGVATAWFGNGLQLPSTTTRD